MNYKLNLIEAFAVLMAVFVLSGGAIAAGVKCTVIKGQKSCAIDVTQVARSNEEVAVVQVKSEVYVKRGGLVTNVPHAISIYKKDSQTKAPVWVTTRYVFPPSLGSRIKQAISTFTIQNSVGASMQAVISGDIRDHMTATLEKIN